MMHPGEALTAPVMPRLEEKVTDLQSEKYSVYCKEIVCSLRGYKRKVLGKRRIPAGEEVCFRKRVLGRITSMEPLLVFKLNRSGYLP